MIVTIDGPAGAGKSTVAKRLAQKLGFDYLDTGAMFRMVALAAELGRISLSDEESLKSLLLTINLEIRDNRFFLNHKDVSELIRSPAISKASGAVASSAVVRENLKNLQRDVAHGRKIVCEGRDLGTVVFPEAFCKFFLTASDQVRARRRFEELKENNPTLSFEEILEDQKQRDQRDEGRSIAPLKAASDAVLIDSSELDLDQVLGIMVDTVDKRLKNR